MLTRFVSYAQNFEDVMLWRALKSFPPGQYVDVGAHDPVHFSVTKAFYERGWRGVNIDAVPEIVERLKQDRPEDVNYALFVGVNEGNLDLYQIGDTGISTFKEDYAEQHKSLGYEVSKIQVRARMLTSILEEYSISNDDFHFLKIDVEGAESEVLLGLDLEKFRPWIVVVEATEPNSKVLSLNFEPLLLTKRYQYVYFDGLNRFYVAEERSDLIQSFQSPPCVFDDFDLWETVRAREAVATAESHHVSTLNYLHMQLASENQLVRTRDDTICSKNALIDSKNELIKAKNLIIIYKDELIEVKNAIILSRDSAILSKDELIETKMSIIHQQDSVIFSKDSMIVSRDAHIHGLHTALVHYGHRASHLYVTFASESERTRKGLSGAYKMLYSSALWRHGAWIAALFRSKSPRAPLNKAAATIKNSNFRIGRGLKDLRDDITRTTDTFGFPPSVRSRLGKSAAAMSDLINAGYSAKQLKP